MKTFKYGALRQTADPTLVFDFAAHKSDYGMMGDYVTEGIQKQMVNQYGLKEVMIPEEDQLGEADSKDAKNNIFMTPDFYRPDENQKKLNAGKTALVLIQGTGAVRAGYWARSVCINANYELGSMLP